MPNFLSGHADADGIERHVEHTALHIDTPQPSYYDFGTPIFDGSIDWHSSVHAHLATVLNFEEAGDVAGLDAFVTTRFQPADVQAEADANVDDEYGWAWLLKLDSTLRELGYDALAPAGDAYAARLAEHLTDKVDAGTSDSGAGSYNDSFWQVANLHQWADLTGDTELRATATDLFDAIVADTNIDGETPIDGGGFFSSVGIAAYAHVVTGVTDSPVFEMLSETLLDAVESGELTDMLDQVGTSLENGAGYGHAPGQPISLGFGYWAAFSATGNPAFYDAYEQIAEWTVTHADAMGDTIQTGHWLPNFATFALSLPADLEVPETPELIATLQDYGIDIEPYEVAPGPEAAAEFTLSGPDAQLFTIDAGTGEVALQDWFTPDLDDAWDQNEDHVYDIVVTGFAADGTLVSETDLQMTNTADGIVWSSDQAPEPVDPVEPEPGDIASYTLEGDDAFLFAVDETGLVTNKDWFTPDLDDPWDLNEDNVYEYAIVGQSTDGIEVSRVEISFDASTSGEAIMQALAVSSEAAFEEAPTLEDEEATLEFL